MYRSAGILPLLLCPSLHLHHCSSAPNVILTVMFLLIIIFLLCSSFPIIFSCTGAAYIESLTSASQMPSCYTTSSPASSSHSVNYPQQSMAHNRMQMTMFIKQGINCLVQITITWPLLLSFHGNDISMHTQRQSAMQGSKLGWSCGPSLPELLADHQIVLCGGPVVYWEFLTINFDNICKMFTDTFYGQCHIFFNTIYVLQGIFKCLFW